MLIYLYKTTSDKNVVFKNLTEENSYECVLKDVTSVLNPQIMIATTVDINNYNYAYIPQFSRYYYINNVDSVKYGLWRLDFSVDVLMTYSPYISYFDVIISRSEHNETEFLRDSESLEYVFKDVITTQFPQTPLTKSTTTYLLTTLGKGGVF